MSVKTPKARFSRTPGAKAAQTADESVRERLRQNLQEVLSELHVHFSALDLVTALEDLQRSDAAVDLPAHDREFWAAHSGITTSPATVARGSARNAAARVLMDSSSLSAAAVAENLNLSASTVRHYRAEGKLYSYLANGRLLFPAWQFTKQGHRALPGLDRVLSSLPGDLHPQAVAGFFLSPQPDLVINGEEVSVAAWLEDGGSAEPVLTIADALAAGY
ncbi:hypothetical protein QMY03_09560 [Arthrobacter sp. KFRI-F3372]|nr:hypothetical protein QMY03_09560 [Arthrobacter sp. KFRI-F3372]